MWPWPCSPQPTAGEGTNGGFFRLPSPDNMPPPYPPPPPPHPELNLHDSDGQHLECHCGTPLEKRGSPDWRWCPRCRAAVSCMCPEEGHAYAEPFIAGMMVR